MKRQRINKPIVANKRIKKCSQTQGQTKSSVSLVLHDGLLDKSIHINIPKLLGSFEKSSEGILNCQANGWCN